MRELIRDLHECFFIELMSFSNAFFRCQLHTWHTFIALNVAIIGNQNLHRDPAMFNFDRAIFRITLWLHRNQQQRPMVFIHLRQTVKADRTDIQKRPPLLALRNVSSLILSVENLSHYVSTVDISKCLCCCGYSLLAKKSVV